MCKGKAMVFLLGSAYGLSGKHEERRKMALRQIHHVQLAMPEGREREAVAFYAGLLALSQVEKPPALKARGGAWFEAGDVRVHLGVEPGFRPARKAHPAFAADDLEALLAKLDAAGIEIRRDSLLPGYRRAYVSDPFGNRIELLEACPSS